MREIQYQILAFYCPILTWIANILSCSSSSSFCKLFFSFFITPINYSIWWFFYFCSLRCLLLNHYLFTSCSLFARVFLLKYPLYGWFYPLILLPLFPPHSVVKNLLFSYRSHSIYFAFSLPTSIWLDKFYLQIEKPSF